jgi:AraC-like DNA-binding protein
LTERKQRPKADIDTLAALISTHAPYDGSFELRVPGIHAIRVSQPHKELTHYTQQSCVCIVAQGAKTATIGEESFEYKVGQVAVYSIDVPLAARVTTASAASPYLNFKIDLDAEKIRELALKVFPHGTPQSRELGAIHLAGADADLIDAASRLLDLMSKPSEAEILAPLVRDEILIRLLRTAIGPRIAEIGRVDSSVGRIALAVSWLREHFDDPVSIDDLAQLVNMSVTTFHRQFKAVTSMSPLQYQKALRFQEARRLMLTAALDPGAAGRRVGYASASQFTREYGRFFGNAPTRDLHRLREHGIAETEISA